jgi:signal transduction histidine kinase/ActR/RegA family two-component response regulator
VSSNRYPFSISKKVWLSLSIMVIGYLASMIFGFILGIKIEFRLNRVSESVFPAAMESKAALTKFKELAKNYQDAVVLGEEDRLTEANISAREAQGALNRLVKFIEYHKTQKKTVEELLNELINFTAAANSFYARMLSEIDNEALAEKAKEMSRRTGKLQEKLIALTDTLSINLKRELESVNHDTRNQQYLNMMVFLLVVTLSFILVSIIISRAVTRPLQKAAALADAMAEGDLSRKLDIRQQDEIGGLARAMNIMAEKIEVSYAMLEQKVADRTASLEETNKKLREEIAERKRTEAELKKTRDKLVETARLAEEANKSKSEFLANMSHEIRTPLTGVIGMTEMLLNTRLSPEQQDYVESINVSGETLLAIINDILDISKIEAGEFHLGSAPFDLEKSVEDVVRVFTPQAYKKGLDFQVYCPSGACYRVIGDQVRVRQIVFNLVGNALKFTNAGKIAIRVAPGEVNENIGQFHIEIQDTGIGIEPEFMENIFKKFTQGDASDTRKYGGTGLGLFITRQMVEIMGGSIHVESTPGEGSIFRFILPLTLDAESVLTVPVPAAGNLTRRKTIVAHDRKTVPLKILLAEDNKINQKLIAAIIKKAGYSIDIVENGKAAVGKMKTNAYALVLMDIQMPEMNGLDATKAIREGGFLEIPIIAMTASAFARDRKMCLEAGMNDFIAKPLKQAELLEMISKWRHKTSPDDQLAGC